jgi:hypothetical protein
MSEGVANHLVCRATVTRSHPRRQPWAIRIISSHPPFSNWGTGYKPPDFFGDQFKLKWNYVPSWLGWSIQTKDGQVINLGATLPGAPAGLNDSFTSTMAAIARALDNQKNIDPKQVAQVFGGSADDNVWDTLYGLLRKGGQGLWPDVPGNKPNIAKGGPASVGKVDPSGTVIPPSADDAVAGAGIPSPAISLGKRFPFISHPDVHLYVYVDKDAYPNKPNLLFSGAGVGIEGKTSGGNPVKLRIGAGRDESGGKAGFLTFQIGPDYVPQTPQP